MLHKGLRKKNLLMLSVQWNNSMFQLDNFEFETVISMTRGGSSEPPVLFRLIRSTILLEWNFDTNRMDRTSWSKSPHRWHKCINWYRTVDANRRGFMYGSWTVNFFLVPMYGTFEPRFYRGDWQHFRVILRSKF